MSLAPNFEMAAEYLRLLAPGVQRFSFQSYTDNKEKRETYSKNGARDPAACVMHGTLDECLPALTNLSAAGAGIFVTVNETNLRGRKGSDVVRVRACYVDLDGSPPSVLRRLKLRPHLVVQTSPERYHSYWLVSGAPLDQFSKTQKRLIELMESDRSVHDLSRVMRLPGFPHQKDPTRPFLVTAAIVEEGPPYEDLRFQAALAQAEAIFGAGTGRGAGSARPDMTQGYPDGHRTPELTRRAGYCLGPDKMTEEETLAACLAWNKYNTPPLPEEKVAATVASIARAEARKSSSADSHDETAAQAREPSQREKLVSIGLSADLWHDEEGNPYATVDMAGHKESFRLNGSKFRQWLTREYGKRNEMEIDGQKCPSAPSTQALNEAINALGAKAVSGDEHRPTVRVAGHDGNIYLDLGTPDWSVVEISAEGWHVVSSAPVRFIRPPGMRPLPVPARGGNIKELAPFLNIATASDFVLIVSWLLAALRPTGPYSVLIINGEQGSGKTICCRILRRLIDPNAAELRNELRDERDMLLAAKNGWVVALDNLSYVRNDLSDAICRIASKGGFATRALYTNDEEFLIEVCRPVLLNGIPPLASRADLADRAIICVLPTMNTTSYRTEEELWSEFDLTAPLILGGLLDGVSGALRDYKSIELNHRCRMMDFARWAEAGCRALGLTAGTFEAAYVANRSTATEDALDADPVGAAVIKLIAREAEFRGTATELLTALENYVLPAQRDRRWPKDATRLGGHLRRLAPLLRARQIEIEFDERSRDAARNRLIVVKCVGPK